MTLLIVGWGRSIENFTYDDIEMGELFWNLTRNTSFEGVSVSPVDFFTLACLITLSDVYNIMLQGGGRKSQQYFPSFFSFFHVMKSIS